MLMRMWNSYFICDFFYFWYSYKFDIFFIFDKVGPTTPFDEFNYKSKCMANPSKIVLRIKDNTVPRWRKDDFSFGCPDKHRGCLQEKFVKTLNWHFSFNNLFLAHVEKNISIVDLPFGLFPSWNLIIVEDIYFWKDSRDRRFSKSFEALHHKDQAAVQKPKPGKSHHRMSGNGK